MITSARYLVIGGGIAGASVAFELAKYGSAVLLEREHVAGYHATGRSAALLQLLFENPLVRKLIRASKPFLQDPPAWLSDRPLLRPRGNLYVARSDQRGILDEVMRAAPDLRNSIEMIDGDEAISIVPVLRRDYVSQALYEPDAMDIDVDGVHRGFLRAFVGRGGTVVLEAEVIGFSRHRSVWHVDTSQGPFTAPIVVNAAGAWADEIAELAGIDALGLVPKRRTIIVFHPPDQIDPSRWPGVEDIAGGWYFKPDSGGILASPGDQTPMSPSDVQPEEIDVALGADLIEQVTSWRVGRLSSRWAGLRTFAPDGSPIVGFDPDAEGFFWLAGQAGYGIMTAATLARAAAVLIARGCLPADLSDLGIAAESMSPARLKAVRPTTVQKSLS